MAAEPVSHLQYALPNTRRSTPSFTVPWRSQADSFDKRSRNYVIELRSRGIPFARLPRRVPEKTQHAAERLPPGARRISSRFRWRKALPEAAAIKKDSMVGIRLGPFSAVARPPQRFWAKRVRVQRASKLNAQSAGAARAGVRRKLSGDLSEQQHFIKTRLPGGGADKSAGFRRRRRRGVTRPTIKLNPAYYGYKRARRGAPRTPPRSRR